MPTDARTWQAVDTFIESSVVHPAPALAKALERCHAAKLPPISVSVTQGRLLALFARLMNAKRILEIGTLGGYSTLCLAEGLAPGGTIVTLEIDEAHARVARENFAAAGVSDRINLRVAPAADTLAKLVREKAEPFDLFFIDADKQSTPAYLTASIQLARPGSLIIIDNVIRDGAILDSRGDASVQGIRKALEMIGHDPRLTATAIQTVGSKGYDGLAMAVVR